MSTINWLFEINFAIFSVFLTLFVTELMAAVLLLFFYEEARPRVLGYIVPIWEVTGTFAAFWVVTADFAYPAMLYPVATLLAPFIVVFLIFLVARNASISYAEYIVKRRWLDEKMLYRAYALSTLLLGVVAVLMLSAIVSGAGVDLSTLSFSTVGWLTNAGSVPYLLGVLVLGVGLAPVFYDLEKMRRLALPFTAIGVVVEASALYLYSPAFLSVWFLVPAVLTILPALLYQYRATAPLVANKLLFGLVATIVIFSQSYLVYPTAFHGGISVDAVTTSGPMVGAFYVLSAAGAVIVGLLMVLYLTAVVRVGRAPPPARAPSPELAPHAEQR